MDTPERNRLNTPVSKFEDSPVFNYINNLSPIKTVKSVHITQTFNSLSFSSPPSVFTSPHVSCLKESRFVSRHNQFGTSKPKVSSEDVNKVHSSEEALAIHGDHDSNEPQENADRGISVEDASIELSGEHTKFSVELPQALQYNCGSTSYDPPLRDDEANTLLELPGEAAPEVAYVQQIVSIEHEVHIQEMCQVEENGEGADCDWDSLLPNATDLLLFNSPNQAETFKNLMQKPLRSSMRLGDVMSLLPQSTLSNDQNIHTVDSVVPGAEHEIEANCSETVAINSTEPSQDTLADVDLSTSNPNEKMDDKVVSVTHRGTRRRCLDFEMASVRTKNSDGNSNASSSTTQSEVRIAANEKQLLPIKRDANSQRRMLPGIGLHLNALATFTDYKGIQQSEKFSSSGRQLSLASSSSLQLSASLEHQNLVPVTAERELDPSENGVQPAEDSSQAASEDFNQNSPKKKRRKVEPAGDTEGCKRCNCKKSKCLKLYCECFAAGVYCIEPCSCQDCFNKPIHEDTVLQTRKQIESRNPLAFAPKVIRNSDSVPEIGDDPNKTPASARHKRGCNCKKSNCLKKYCECYQGGVGCSISCRCEGCKNAFGRKDGSAQAEPEEETETSNKGVMEKALQKTEIQNIEEHQDSSVAATPLRLSRPLLPLPFSSKGKPPRSFVTTISGSALFTSQKLGKPNSLWSQANKHFQGVVPEDDEMPDILHGDSSPIACIKSSSPNSKRISSPNCEMRSSPSRRGGRKLILQSIPSFPSLTTHP
uniref:Transcription factor CPP n=2 Tax=Lotus japonicus TaxID=34305 RepID=B3IX45_LOTJA|nr:transcription factor CPP [Lotus japonicus]